jgi:type IV secretion system protein VirB10
MTTEAPPEAESDTVAGERGPAAVNRPPSLQSRVSNLLAVGLMGAMTLGLMGWYYVSSFSDRAAARESAQTKARDKAQGETVLPPLGRIDPPAASPSFENLLGPAPEAPPADTQNTWPRPAVQTPAPPATARSGATTPEDLILKRKLSGTVLSRQRLNAAAGESDPGLEPVDPPPGSDLDALFRPSVTPAVQAQVLPTQTLLLPKGGFLDCTLETAIDSTLPGMTTCIMATDTFGADGKVVLLERGTKLVGETRGQVQRGSARIFVLWNEARTPHGVVVPLASPGTDELGRSGLAGKVNRHFFERFGAAILISVIDGAIQREVQSGSAGGTVIYSPSASQDIATEVLRSTVNIPPTVVKPQGDRIQVLVARDLDFRSAYELRPAAADR